MNSDAPDRRDSDGGTNRHLVLRQQADVTAGTGSFGRPACGGVDRLPAGTKAAYPAGVKAHPAGVKTAFPVGA